MHVAMWGRAPRISQGEGNQYNHRYGLVFPAGLIGEVALKLVFQA